MRLEDFFVEFITEYFVIYGRFGIHQMETFRDDLQPSDIINQNIVNLDEILSGDAVGENQNSQVHQAPFEGNAAIGDGYVAMQEANLAIETQASTSRSKTKVRRRTNGQVRSIIPRTSKSRAKNMIRNIVKGIVPKKGPQGRRSVRSKFKRNAVRSDATLRRRLDRIRSSESLLSNLCPRCGHSCCNWFLN